MAVPVARVHLKVAHAALPALLPTPPKWKMLPPLFQTPCPGVAAVLPKPPLAKPSRADADERWDAHMAKPGHGSPRKNAISPPPKPGRADSAARWDAQKKAALPASSSSSSATSSLVSSPCKISRASSSERWDMHKKRCPPQAKLLDDVESSCTGGNDDIDDMEEEIVWMPRAMYAGPGFVAVAPETRMLPMPTAFLVRVA